MVVKKVAVKFCLFFVRLEFETNLNKIWNNSKLKQSQSWIKFKSKWKWISIKFETSFETNLKPTWDKYKSNLIKNWTKFKSNSRKI